MGGAAGEDDGGMSPNTAKRATQPHIGSGSHSHGRSANPLVNYELAGPVRWLDVDLERMVVGVEETDGHAGAFQGRDVTVDLEAAHVFGGTIHDLVPGAQVRVKTRLRRDLGGTLPDLLPAHSVLLEAAG